MARDKAFYYIDTLVEKIIKCDQDDQKNAFCAKH